MCSSHPHTDEMCTRTSLMVQMGGKIGFRLDMPLDFRSRPCFVVIETNVGRCPLSFLPNLNQQYEALSVFLE